MRGCADRLTLAEGVPVGEVADWLTGHGITRYLVTGAASDGIVRAAWQETYHSPVQPAVPGDVLCAHDLGGSTGRRTVINHGPEELPR